MISINQRLSWHVLEHIICIKILSLNRKVFTRLILVYAKTINFEVLNKFRQTTNGIYYIGI